MAREGKEERGFEEREGTAVYKQKRQHHRNTECSSSCDSEASGEEGNEWEAFLARVAGRVAGKSVLHLYTCLLNVFVEFVRRMYIWICLVLTW
jgi:hypothetical protein